MKIILPTGEDGADKAYPGDDLVLSLTGSEIMTLVRCTGVTPDFLIEQAIRSGMKDAPSPAADPGFMRMHLAYAWIARFRAGERREDGEPFTCPVALFVLEAMSPQSPGEPFSSRVLH